MILILILYTWLIFATNPHEKFKWRTKSILHQLEKVYVLLHYGRRNKMVPLCHKLGPLFIKLGQWQSSKRGLIPDDICDQLVTLQNQVPPHAWKYSEPWINVPVNKNPIASGSIAQVYTNGDIAIKVNHPNIQNHMKYSIDFFDMISKTLCLISPTWKKWHQSMDPDEFIESIMNQTDLHTEAHHFKLFQETWPHIIVPTVQHVCSNTLVTSYEPGISFQQFRKEYPDRIYDAFCELWWFYHSSFLKHNLMHGDLHEGNFSFRLENNKVKLVIYDLGLTTCINNPEQQKIIQKVWSVIIVPNPIDIVEYIKICNQNPDAINLDQIGPKLLKEYSDFGHVQSYIAQNGYLQLLSQSLETIEIYDKSISEHHNDDVFKTLMNMMIESKIVLNVNDMNIFIGMLLLEDLAKQIFNQGTFYIAYTIISYGVKMNYFCPESGSILI